MRMPKKKPFLTTIKALEVICGIIILIGFFLAIGSIGGCERGTLSEGKAIMYGVIGLIMAAAGALGARWFSSFDEPDEDDEDDED